MALDKDVLGQSLYTKANTYNDIDVDTTDPAAVDAYRLAFWKGVAEVIINHFKANGVLKVPGLGLVAGNVLVTGNSVTGKIE